MRRRSEVAVAAFVITLALLLAFLLVLILCSPPVPNEGWEPIGRRPVIKERAGANPWSLPRPSAYC